METKAALTGVCAWTAKGLLAIALVLTASGCASVVYKDSATTFVASGQAAGKQIEEASKSLDGAQDAIRRTKIASDSSCPIAEKRLFVRGGAGEPETIRAALKRFKNQDALPGCQTLLSCERSLAQPGAAPMECRSVCYSKAEGNCLAQLERSYAIELKETAVQSGADHQALQSESSSLMEYLQKTEYQRAGSVESRLVGAGVKELSAYLDVLGEVTEGRKSDYPEDAKKLSERLGALTKGLGEVSGQQLSAASQATQKQVQNALGAFGKLAGLLQTMSQDAADARKIQRLVSENKVNVEGLIATLHAVALGDGTLAATYSDLAAITARQALQARFEKTRDPYARSLLLAERENYLYSNGEAMTLAVNAVFDSLSKSHLALVSLVENPNDEQKKALVNARLQNFKAVVRALADVVQAVR
ncbi:hypothetical protein LL967_08090 [Xanthomonas campestris pv. zinniae]|nr:hypothetical protein [Xanthomonas campestris pv. zinniae]